MTDFPRREAERLIRDALDEDVGQGDITTLATVAEGTLSTAKLVAKEHLRLAGVQGFVMVFEMLDPQPLAWRINHRDGEDVEPGAVVLEVTGDGRQLLTGERVGLNILGKLSGIATMTKRWTGELANTRAQLIDTRKTTPGLRALEKYSVRVGGGANHRIGLFDGVLIKENHIRAAGSITEAVERARRYVPHTIRVEVEVTDMTELEEALAANVDALLLDNMEPDELARAVELNGGRAILEASGGVTFERLAAIARTGVDLISVGALTHSAPNADLSFLFD